MLNMRSILILLVTFFLIFLAIINFFFQNLSGRENTIDKSVNRAIIFLKNKQTEEGFFQGLACDSPNMSTCVTPTSNQFITGVMISALAKSQHPELKMIVSKALNRFSLNELAGGVWQYFDMDDIYTVQPELDTTSFIAGVLRDYDFPFKANNEFILENKDAAGRFYLWLPKDEPFNEVDCAVNANILSYLRANDGPVCQFIIEMVESEDGCSLYYKDIFVKYYFIVRAQRRGVDCLGELNQKIISFIISQQKDNGSFGSDLDTALALNILIGLKYDDKLIEKGIKYLLSAQNKDGSWDEAVFYSTPNRFLLVPQRDKIIHTLLKLPEDLIPVQYYGGRDFTTAIVIELFNDYLESKVNN